MKKSSATTAVWRTTMKIHARSIMTRTGALLLLGLAAITIALVAMFSPSPVQATPTALSTAANPWTLTETDPTQPGLVVHCAPLMNGQCTEWFDYEGNPIATVNRAGGFAVLGDNISIFQPGMVFDPSVQMTITDPTPAQCQHNNYLRISGASGHIFKCTVGVGWSIIL